MAISEHTFDLELCPKSGIGLKYNFYAHLSILSSFYFLDKVLGLTVTEKEPFRVIT